jgi:hypothetical protein
MAFLINVCERLGNFKEVNKGCENTMPFDTGYATLTFNSFQFVEEERSKREATDVWIGEIAKNIKNNGP